MGKGSRPAKANNLVLVSGATQDVMEKAAAAAAELYPGQHEPPPSVVMEIATSMAPTSETEPVPTESAPPAESEAAAVPTADEAPPPVVEPDLAELQELKERIRKEYPEFRDTFGHQFNEPLVPQLTNLSQAELGLPEGTEADRVRREVRALAFARSYVIAKAGDAEGLKGDLQRPAVLLGRPTRREGDQRRSPHASGR